MLPLVRCPSFAQNSMLKYAKLKTLGAPRAHLSYISCLHVLMSFVSETQHAKTHADAEKWKGVSNKIEYFSEKPGKGD